MRTEAVERGVILHYYNLDLSIPLLTPLENICSASSVGHQGSVLGWETLVASRVPYHASQIRLTPQHDHSALGLWASSASNSSHPGTKGLTPAWMFVLPPPLPFCMHALLGGLFHPAWVLWSSTLNSPWLYSLGVEVMSYS